MEVNTEIKKIYEDDSIVVINKPSGILVHSDGLTKEKNVTDWVLENYPETHNVGEESILKNGEKIIRPGIVHRLDKDTSGALIICKTKNAYSYFKKMFQDKNIKKEYHTFVYGDVKKEKFTINEAIGRHPVDFRKRLADKNARGEMREATTNFEVIKKTSQFSFLHAFPLTGRTHQIRVHLKSINHPIVCDSLYAPKQPCLLGFNRLALHAYKISWINEKGEEKHVIAEYPIDFENAVKEINNS